MASLAWLTGCWVEDLGPVRVVDEWAAPAGHTMLGVSRELHGDSTVALELRRLSDSAGVVTLLTITKAGQLPLYSTRFDLTDVEFVNTTGGHRTVVRFVRDGAHQMEIGRERQFSGVARTLNELFDRTACTN